MTGQAEHTKVLGVIGARSGSKTVPHKNIKPLCGKPLLAWIAEAARKSTYVSRLIISTDSPEYAHIAQSYDVEAPFLRPAELAQDAVPDFDYLYHAATWLAVYENWQAEIILRLPPTTPFCQPEHLDACIQLLLDDPTADSARTIAPASKHPYKLWKTHAGYLEPFLSEEFTGLKDAHNMPRQAFPPAYQHVDVIALRWKTLVDDKSMAGRKVRYHIIPKMYAIDIDSELDFFIAEKLMERFQAFPVQEQ
jgi:N-acylneuraminate cytidylyltransferase